MKKEKLTSKWSLKKPLYINKTDKRYKKYTKQLKDNGFCDVETWNLDGVISEFILPRLKRFKEVNICFPMDLTPDKWNKILDEMIFAFEWNLVDELSDEYEKLSKKELTANWERCKEGRQLFAQYFKELWW